MRKRDGSRETLPPSAVEQMYGWENEPKRVRLMAERARKDGTMELRFWNDPETGLPHIYDHGVTEEEVQQVLSRPGEDFSGRDHSRIRLGQTLAGRYLQVVYVPDAGRTSAFVVTALELSTKAKRAFRRRQRRKRR